MHQREDHSVSASSTAMDCVHVVHWLMAAVVHSESNLKSEKRPRQPTPTVPDTWEWPNGRTEWVILNSDVTKAHRRMKVLRRGWHFQVAKLGKEWFVNQVGTYGMACAQLYWDRMATLLALGTSLSWQKMLSAQINTYLARLRNRLIGPTGQMAADKHLLVRPGHAAAGGPRPGQGLHHKETEKGLGRLQWATTCCPLTKSLLRPLWAWKMACKTSGKPGALIRSFAALFSELFSLPTSKAPLSGRNPRGGARVMREPPVQRLASAAGCPWTPVRTSLPPSGSTTRSLRSATHGHLPKGVPHSGLGDVWNIQHLLPPRQLIEKDAFGGRPDGVYALATPQRLHPGPLT